LALLVMRHVRVDSAVRSIANIAERHAQISAGLRTLRTAHAAGAGFAAAITISALLRRANLPSVESSQ